MSSLNEPAPNRHFMSDSDQCLLCHVLSYSAYLKHNRARSDSGDPKFGLALTFAHSCFQWLGTYRFVRKYPKIDFAFTMQEMSCCNPTGFNVPGGYPAAFQRLQAVFTKRYKIASRSITLHFVALALTMLNSFRHHYHFFRPLQTYI
jgi:hypothetical protein